jgi:branched-chain amino acid transport system ATP-binding protein
MNALELIDVRKSFGKSEIIRGASLTVARGERCAIIGPNGAGKSTLFNLVSGRFPVSGGDICLNGRSISGMRPFEINRLGARSSRSATCSSACRCMKPALRGAVVARLPVFVLRG